MPSEKPRSLFMTEGRLRAAWDALSELQLTTDDGLSADEAEAFLARFVDRDSMVGARDEFADFVVEMEAFARAKDDEAAALREQAARIREGVGRMKASALRTMCGLGVDELRGHHRLLKVKRSRGAVMVMDEGAIPPAYWRVAEDDDLRDARIIYAAALAGGSSPEAEEADRAMQAIAGRRRMVDKKAIQEAWKEAGSDSRVVRPDEFPAEQRAEMERAAALMVTASGEDFDGVRVPVVPGVVKEVTTTLEIR